MIAKASITFVTKMQTAPILLDSIIALAKKDFTGNGHSCSGKIVTDMPSYNI